MRENFHSVQGLRGVACLLVLGIHAAGWEHEFGVAREFLKPFRWFGFAGVDLFFVISGFIIAHTQWHGLGKPSAVPGFLMRRAWRIYPLFWLVMILAYGLYEVAMSHSYQPPWVDWLTLSPNIQPNWYITPAWTLCYEILFYAVFGVLMIVPKRFAPALFVAWAVAIGIAEFVKTDDRFHCATWFQTLVSPMIWEFLLGVLVAGLVRRNRLGRGRTAIGFGLLWAVVGSVLTTPAAEPYWHCAHHFERSLVYGPASALLIFGCIAAERAGTLRTHRFLLATGDASYSIYLWHGPVGMALHFSILWWPHHTVPHLAWLAFMAAVCWGGGLLLHRYVERPLLNFGKQLDWQRRTAKPQSILVGQWKVPSPRVVLDAGENEAAAPSPLEKK